MNSGSGTVRKSKPRVKSRHWVLEQERQVEKKEDWSSPQQTAPFSAASAVGQREDTNRDGVLGWKHPLSAAPNLQSTRLQILRMADYLLRYGTTNYVAVVVPIRPVTVVERSKARTVFARSDASRSR
jgi:hypothetical protein